MSTRTNYELLKYSRSYTPQDAARLSAQPTSSDSEWQHFANPTLHLLLMVDSTGGSLRSARVHIEWTPVRKDLLPTHQENVVLEDIDLLAFPPVSSLSSFGAKPQSQSLPLKVVYRDSIVGFRYLHPHIIPTGSAPTYRRFQVSFTDPLLATQFINSIRQICPCKQSPPAPAQAVGVRPHNTACTTPVKQTNNMNGTTKLLPIPSRYSSQSHVSGPSLNDNMQHHWSISQAPITPKHIEAAPQRLEQFSIQRGSTLPPFDLVPSNSQSTIQTSLEGAPPSLPSSSLVSISLQEGYKANEHTCHDPNAESALPRASTSMSIPPSSFTSPFSSSQDPWRPHISSVAFSGSVSNEPLRTSPLSNPDEPNRELRNSNSNDQSTGSPLTSSKFTRDPHAVEELHGMPLDQLERFIGEVIREPGFLPLLEKLDRMWKVKAFVNRAYVPTT